ncbi:FKBP-type peptidyl-prolyl cis-trans isomerase [Candidatus Saccharibacteria bacterium]|nr:FKBP-type peptidyl-prolyl cis-trans isomerase [Candidatus Saccharibacteria bacterium]
MAAVGYLFYKYDQASQPVIVSSESNYNGNGIALPGLDGNLGQQTLQAPATQPQTAPNSQQGSTGQQSSSSSQQSQPVRSQTLSNGLKIEEYNSGQGDRKTKVGDTVAVHYIGYFTDGNVFDTSLKGEKKPFAFKLGAGQVIQGWDIGLQDMKVGVVRRLTVPASLAYGERGYPPAIPPNATLVFDVQLMAIQ